MKSLKNSAIEVLKKLKKEFSAVAIKADFEAEGVCLSELVFLVDVVRSVGLKMFFKIGGCEAVSNLRQTRLFGADAVIVPVVESDFALKKFFLAAKKIFGDELGNLKLILNAETKTCAQNFDDILAFGSSFLDAVTIGRVDLAGSLNLSRNEIDGNEVFKFCSKFFVSAKQHGLVVGLGGGIGSSSFDFLKKLDFDRFETRKIVFENCLNEKSFCEAVSLATDFELICLKFKQEFFNELSVEDVARLNLLKNRLKGFKN